MCFHLATETDQRDGPAAGSEPLGKDAGLPEAQIWGAKSEQQSRVHGKDSRPLVLRRGHESLHYSAWAGPCFATTKAVECNSCPLVDFQNAL